MTASPLATAAESLATAASQVFSNAEPLALVAVFPNGGYAAAYLGEPSSEQYTEAAIAFGELAQEAREKADA
jgi:hypothetical protein